MDESDQSKLTMQSRILQNYADIFPEKFLRAVLGITKKRGSLSRKYRNDWRGDGMGEGGRTARILSKKARQRVPGPKTNQMCSLRVMLVYIQPYVGYSDITEHLWTRYLSGDFARFRRLGFAVASEDVPVFFAGKQSHQVGIARVVAKGMGRGG